MKILTLVKKQKGYCEQSRHRNMQQDVKQPCVKVKRFSLIEVEEAEDGSKVYQKGANPFSGNIFYKKGEYVNLSTLIIVSVGVIAGSVFAYQKFKN